MAGVTAYSSSFVTESDVENRRVSTLILLSGLRSWKKRMIRFKNKVKNGAYPAHLESLWVIMGVVMALHFVEYNGPVEAVKRILARMPA